MTNSRMLAGSDDVRVHRLVAAAVGCCLGAEAGLSRHALLAIVAGLLVMAVGAQAKSGRRQVTIGVALGLVVASGSAMWHRHELLVGPVAAAARAHADVEVAMHPVRDAVAISGSAGGDLSLLDATVTEISVNSGPALHTSKPVIVFGYGRAWSQLIPGEPLRVSGRLQPPRPADGVAAVLDASGSPQVLGPPPWWQRWAERIRAGLAAACSRLPTDERSLVPALVLGVVTPLPAAMKHEFQVTGLTHLIAVSGENLAVLLALVVTLGARLGWRRRSRTAAATFVIVAFVITARPSPSVLRAAAMGLIAVVAIALGRRAAPLPTLSLSVIGLLLVDPFLIHDLGFGLSVAATAGLLIWSKPLAARLSGRLPSWLAMSVAIPMAAQLACTPLLVAAFGRLTPYAVPANLLAGLGVAPATVAGVAVAVVSLVSVSLASWLAWVAALPAAAITEVARVFAALPGADLPAPRALSWLVIGVVAVVAVDHRRRRPPLMAS